MGFLNMDLSPELYLDERKEECFDRYNPVVYYIG
jgi:hypothetical protein